MTPSSQMQEPGGALAAVSTLDIHNGPMPHAVARWGNSLALRIPRSLAQGAGLSEGTAVTVRLENGALVIRSRRGRESW